MKTKLLDNRIFLSSFFIMALSMTYQPNRENYLLRTDHTSQLTNRCSNISILNGSGMPNLDSGHTGDHRLYLVRATGMPEGCTRKKTLPISIMLQIMVILL